MDHIELNEAFAARAGLYPITGWPTTTLASIRKGAPSPWPSPRNDRGPHPVDRSTPVEAQRWPPCPRHALHWGRPGLRDDPSEPGRRMIQSFKGMVPVIDPSARPPAGHRHRSRDHRPGLHGPGAVLRGDWGRIVLERGCNVQENCVVHMFPGTTVHLSEGAYRPWRRRARRHTRQAVHDWHERRHHGRRPSGRGVHRRGIGFPQDQERMAFEDHHCRPPRQSHRGRLRRHARPQGGGHGAVSAIAGGLSRAPRRM